MDREGVENWLRQREPRRDAFAGRRWGVRLRLRSRSWRRSPGGAFADNLQSDLNTTTGGLQKTVNLGTLPANTFESQDVFLFVQTQPGAANDPTYPFDVTGSKDASSTFPGTTTFSGVTISGPDTANGKTGQVTWTTPAAQATQQSYSIVEKFAADTSLNTSPATVTINFTIAAAPTNHPPVVNAAGSYSGNEGSGIPLTGASATDQDSADTLTYSWSIAADPAYSNPSGAACSFSDGTVLNPTVTCNDNGHWILTLSVSDGHVASPVTDTATLDVGNVAPTGTFNRPSAHVSEGSTFNLSISGVSDPSSNDTAGGFQYAFDCGSGYGSYDSSSSVRLHDGDRWACDSERRREGQGQGRGGLRVHRYGDR
jgi:hypothetical protein